MSWSFAVTIVLNIAGWLIVHRLSSLRDRKKEWREFARSSVKIVETIENDAVKYHTSLKREISLESSVNCSIDLLDMHMQLVKKNLNMSMDVSFFRAAITLDNFQTKKFERQSNDSELVRNIFWHAATIKQSLYTSE